MHSTAAHPHLNAHTTSNMSDQVAPSSSAPTSARLLAALNMATSSAADSALSTKPSMAIAATIERLVYPMLNTLTAELQAWACCTEEKAREEKQQMLSLYASVSLNRSWTDYNTHVDFSNLTCEERYKLTTRMPHEDAMRSEVEAFTSWLEDIMYMTLAEALNEFKDLLPEALGRERDTDRLLLDVLSKCHSADTLYCLFRKARPVDGKSPISYLVFVQLCSLCPELASRVRNSRVKLTLAWRKRVADDAVAAAEQTAREEALEAARAKRRKLG